MNTYAYVAGNPVSRIDPWGLQAHSVCETREILNSIRSQMSTGSPVSAARQAIQNHTGRNAGNIGAHDYAMRAGNPTFSYDGRTMTGAQFGNYAAGYAGWHYGGVRGLAAVLWGGVRYQAEDTAASLLSAGAQVTPFNFDNDGSRDDILAGAKRAQNELANRLVSCGCP